jgi:ATP-binding protein involved in chromosome partitioning
MLTDEQKERVELEDKKISDNIHRIKHRLVVFSGKGGVGKTMVSVNLAYGMQRQGNKTGILDADVTGPNVPKMTGANDKLNIENNFIMSLLGGSPC